MKEIPILLLTGYLGAGKTTLLNRILRNEQGIRFAVIVNDIGEVNIDASLIQRGGVVDTADDSLVPLQNGCICCTLQTDLIKQIEDLAASRRFDYIVIEASGICEPEPIARTIVQIPAILRQAGIKEGRIPTPRLDCIVTVVDALRLSDEFDAGDALKRQDLDEDDIEKLVIQQIEFCDIILLNKASLVAPERLEKVRRIVRELQPRARIIDTDFCDVPLHDILHTHLFDFEKVAMSAQWAQRIEDRDQERHEHDHDHEHHHHDHAEGEAEEYGIGTMVYYNRRPMTLEKFDQLAANWPRGIIRAKGITYFDHRPEMCYLFEQAGRQKNLSENGQWYATMPDDELQPMLERYPDLRADFDPHYGDRMTKLVLIGQNLDRDTLTRQLDGCLGEY